jgi:hypothetical protein
VDWKSYLFIKPALELISQGLVLKKIYGIILKVLAVLIGMGGLVAWIYGWKTIFSSDDVGVILGGIIVELLLMVLIYALIHIMVIRAGNIQDLPEAGYEIIPIMSLSLKLAGELYACIIAFLGVGGGIFHWLAGGSLANFFQNPYLMQLPEFGGLGSVFASGLLTIILGVLEGFGCLVLFYFLAELAIILVDIAASLKNKG